MSGSRAGANTAPVGANGHPASEEAVAADAVEPEALVVTHGFDSGEDGEPYSATVRLTGRRVGIGGRPKPGDTFMQEDAINRIVPGGGPVSISSWVYGLQPGEWTVTADLIRPGIHAGANRPLRRPGRVSAEPIRPADWSWRRWALSTGPATAVRTRWAVLAPLARLPAVVPGSWPALGALGIGVALIVQAAILAHEDVSVSRALAVSLLAVVSGLIAAKLWYAALHPRESWRSKAQGWAVDGFLFVALAVAFTGLIAFDLPIGVYLDASAPGLFFGVAIGRLGCFFTGCCAGRCTRSRWGVWSSDRRVGARRIPTQLLESVADLLIGVATALLVLGDVPSAPGLIFVAAFAAYIVVRQCLLRLRAERREYSWRRSSLVSR